MRWLSTTVPTPGVRVSTSSVDPPTCTSSAMSPSDNTGSMTGCCRLQGDGSPGDGAKAVQRRFQPIRAEREIRQRKGAGLVRAVERNSPVSDCVTVTVTPGSAAAL